ncbi:MAG: 5-formyltetrahydrofolate cyclo-ligase [Actinomycetota bacterium]|nr:5-formyltetrahydrofolate cyclo-ligase [Actinomycetota bacterium]
MSTQGRKVATGLGAAAAAALGVIALNPSIRQEVRRLRDFTRPLHLSPSPPLPPPLPPGRVVSVAGVGELFVRDTERELPAVLLLHGWGASADTNFFRVYPALEQSYRVLALDHRGHGRGLRSRVPFTLEDCADDAAALLHELGLKDAIVVGYSMGGPIALLLAQRHPQRCRGLVLQSTSLEFKEALRERALWRSLNIVEAGLRAGSGGGVLQRALREVVEREPAIEQYRAWLAAEISRSDVRGIVEAGRALSTYDARGWAPTLGLPACAVVTTADRLVSPSKQRALAEALGAEVFEVEADHDAPVTAGTAFAATTRAAVDRVAALAREASRSSSRSPKDLMRETMRRVRREIPPAERSKAAARIVSFVVSLPEIASAHTVLAFASFGSEVPTTELLERLEAAGIQVLLPYLEAGEMAVAAHRSGEPLEPTSYGPREPRLRRHVETSAIDAVILPGLAFDRRGARLGYGGGYYDRFLRGLPAMPALIAIGFAEQVVEQVPATSDDVSVDVIVTDRAVIRVRAESHER